VRHSLVVAQETLLDWNLFWMEKKRKKFDGIISFAKSLSRN
jgi:hypothetical protein